MALMFKLTPFAVTFTSSCFNHTDFTIMHMLRLMSQQSTANVIIRSWRIKLMGRRFHMPSFTISLAAQILTVSLFTSTEMDGEHLINNFQKPLCFLWKIYALQATSVSVKELLALGKRGAQQRCAWIIRQCQCRLPKYSVKALFQTN